jgi:hypothetical protein
VTYAWHVLEYETDRLFLDVREDCFDVLAGSIVESPGIVGWIIHERHVVSTSAELLT